MHSAASATATGTPLDVTGMSVAVIELTGTFTASVAFEALVNTTWTAIGATNLATGVAATTATAAGKYRINVSGLIQIRANLTWTSGTSITAIGTATVSGIIDGAGAAGSASSVAVTSIAAGTNLIGKVGIDQTTPGTTESVTVKTGAHSFTISITRPSDTTAYAINDAIGDTGGSAILAFTNMCRSGGGEIYITSVELELDVATSTIGATTLRLYNANPTAIADNAAWDIPSGDRGKYLGKVKLGTPVDEGSTMFVDNDQINKQITMTGTTLYAILTTDTAFTPASATVKRITVHTLEV